MFFCLNLNDITQLNTEYLLKIWQTVSITVWELKTKSLSLSLFSLSFFKDGLCSNTSCGEHFYSCDTSTLSAPLGSSVLLPCTFTTSSHTVVEWKHTAGGNLLRLMPNGQVTFLLPRGGRVKVFPNQSSRGNYSVRIDELLTSDLGCYCCVMGEMSNCHQVEMVVATGECFCVSQESWLQSVAQASSVTFFFICWKDVYVKPQVFLQIHWWRPSGFWFPSVWAWRLSSRWVSAATVGVRYSPLQPDTYSEHTVEPMNKNNRSLTLTTTSYFSSLQKQNQEQPCHLYRCGIWV